MLLQGTVKSITFHSPQNGFTVLRLTESDSKKVIVVTGTLPDLNVGEKIKFEGEWGNHPKYGKQFKCFGFEILTSESDNLQEYLSSGIFPGIGEKMAQRIIKAFGEETANILDNDPALFRSVKIKGLSAAKVEKFLAAWQENRHSRKTLLFLYNHGIVGSVAKKLWMKYGQETIHSITENPYMLCEDLWGVGFQKADEIALKVGVPNDSPIRMQAAILFALQSSSFNEGHVYLPMNNLLEQTIKILRIPQNDDDIIQLLLSQFETLCSQGRITRMGDDCFFPPMFKAEQQIADNIIFRLSQNAISTDGFEKELIDWERRHKFAFDPIQRKAIQMALAYRISIITGGPGTGKTTVLKGILHLAEKRGEHILLAAPTGRAAKRMSDLCGEKARTIHRLLEVDPITNKFNKNVNNQLACDLLVVDEFSMVDTWLAAALFSATPYRTRIVLVGDADQLPSVGPGNVLNDLIRCPQIPTTRLQHIFRQAGDNDIADKASKINQGLIPSPLDGPNFHFIPFENSDEAKDIIRQLLTKDIKEKMDVNLQSEVQILSPMRKGPLGILELNLFLQDLLNPTEKDDGSPGVTRHKLMGVEWSNGDRVMQIRNNYEKNVFNGDVGIIYKVSKSAGTIAVFFDDKTVEYESDELEQLTLAYASTIHKSQGSEYPAVIVILDTSHYVMLQRNLIYTAITRAKGHVWVLSAPGAFNTAVRNSRSYRRFTRLTERIC